MTDLAALVLAAGEGRRLRPLTTLRPKPLCPLMHTTLLDLAIDRVAAHVAPDAIAVNAHHLAEQVVAHVAGRCHVSVEQPVALGTAGAVGAIASWRDGRDVLITNGDAYYDNPIDLASFVADWDHRRPRLLVVPDAGRADFDGCWRFAGVSLLPAATAASLPAEPLGLYESVWREARLDLVETASRHLDCGDPATYLAANLLASGGESVIGVDAEVHGEVVRSVVWPGAVVHDGERLVQSIRARDTDGGDLTVTVSDLRSPL